jgi:hypothetical protein
LRSHDGDGNVYNIFFKLEKKIFFLSFDTH